MKIPFLPVHIMTNRTLVEKLEDARTEVRELSIRQIFTLVDQNVRLRTVDQNLRLKTGLAPKRHRKVKQ